MTTEHVLGLLRRKLDETDLEVSDWTDEELLLQLRDAVEELGIRGIATFADMSVGTDIDADVYGFNPEPTTHEGHMLAYKAAAMLLKADYQSKVKRGALGMSWRSGLEESSTINQEKAWNGAIKDMERALEELIIHALTDNAGFRAQ